MIVKFRIEKVFAPFYHTPSINVRGTKYHAQKLLRSNTLKINVYVSLKENKLARFANS